MTGLQNEYCERSEGSERGNRSRSRRRRRVILRAGFTIIELLAVVTIMAALTTLLLPAIQTAREAARRSVCQDHLRQLALATLAYADCQNEFPPGVQQATFPVAPVYRGSSLFVHLLPHLEESQLQRAWDFVDPANNALGGATALTATVLPWLLCPSDRIDRNPVEHSGCHYALGSYGGNGGIQSYPPAEATTDGMFHTTGTASEPRPNQRPVRSSQITDGASFTILFGERNHQDANLESFADLGWTQRLSTWGWWSPAGGRNAIGHVTLSAITPINFRLPFSPDTAGSADPPVTDGVTLAYHADRRRCAFGSSHPGGANLVMAGGSAAFVVETTSLSVLQALATRSGAEAVGKRPK